MHLQLFHANHFYIKSIKKSNRPASIISFNSKEKRDRYYNCLVVFTSIEKDDTDISCELAKNEITKIYNVIKSTNKCTSVVITPYSHQDNIETNSIRALKILRKLFELTRTSILEIPVHFGDFGYLNEWKISVKSHHLSCLYRKI